MVVAFLGLLLLVLVVVLSEHAEIRSTRAKVITNVERDLKARMGSQYQF
jgi:hypothetical protein